jgi:phosphopentomutase
LNYGAKEYLSLDASSSSQEVLTTAFQQIDEYNPFFIYLYINDSNLALMKQDPKAYYTSLKNFDLNLGDFIKKLREYGYYDRSMLIITSARSTSASNYVPLLLRGPQCKTNTTINSSLILDVVPTLSAFFTISPPLEAKGIPMYGAMLADEQEQVSLMRKWITGYQKDRLDSWNKQYELQNELDKT